MFTLYHFTLDTASRLVRLVLAEYKLTFEMIEERYWKRDPDFLKLNPASTVPVLLEQGFQPVCGLYPILEFLDETRGFEAGNRRLLPDNANARAEVRRYIDWFMTKFEQEATGPLLHERVIKRTAKLGSPDPATLRAGRQNMKNHLQYFNYLAHERQWLVGNRMSYADLAIAAEISCLDYLDEIDWTQYPAVREWYARLKSRPSFRAILADSILGTAPPPHYADLDF